MSVAGVPRDWAVLTGTPEQAAERDRDGALPHEAVRRLATAGFGALRVPVELGGAGVDLPCLTAAIVDVAAIDPNVAQALRAHFGVVEGLLAAPPSAARTRWLERVAGGTIIGNATTERGRQPDDVATTLRARGEGWTLDGTKHYCTGTLLCDVVAVLARRDDGALVTALVPVDRDGVAVGDDWDGIGQRTSASGSARFAGVAVAGDELLVDAPSGPSTLGSFYQLVLLAVSAGIARGTARDAATLVRSRTRGYAHAVVERPADDPIVQVEVGEIAAAALGAEAVVAEGARAIDRAGELGTVEAAAEAWSVVSAAQVAVDELVVAAADQLFDAGSASAVAVGRALDRHWRNARTIASHNSVPQRARAIGDHLLNGTVPSFGGW